MTPAPPHRPAMKRRGSPLLAAPHGRLLHPGESALGESAPGESAPARRPGFPGPASARRRIPSIRTTPTPASPHRTPVPSPAHPTPRAIRELRSPR